MPIIKDTLAMVGKQNMKYELFVFDNDSQDGTRREAAKYTDKIFNVSKGSYVPGQVLNRGMEATEGDYVVFLNSDCTPADEFWLENLLKGFTKESVAAVFGRQDPRPDCRPLFAKDTVDTYGDGVNQKYWRHCFSMASSAVRRAVWNEFKYSETLQYSEDIHWTWEARKKGFDIRYIPDSVVYHSHNYTLRQFYTRHYGEGKADAFIFDWTPWERSVLRYSLFPYLRQVISDWKYCIRNFAPGSALYSPILRLSQAIGRRKGFNTGKSEL